VWVVVGEKEIETMKLLTKICLASSSARTERKGQEPSTTNVQVFIPCILEFAETWNVAEFLFSPRDTNSYPK
jgi:hypothetical protein